MTVRASALLALALLAAPAAARAQSTPAGELLGAFDRLCLKTASDRTAVLAAADAAGWSPLPDALLSPMAKQFQNAAGRLKSESSGVQFLFVGEQTRPIGGQPVRMRACGLGAVTPDAATVEAGVQSRAGVPPSGRLSESGRTGWVFSDRGGAHTPLDETDEVAGKAAIAAGSARFLMVQKGAGGASAPTIVIEAVPTS